MSEIAVLSLIAAFNPSLLAATTVMLLLPRPERLMFGYWVGAMVMGIVCGLILVFALHGTAAAHSAKHTVSPLIDLALAAIALTVMIVLAARRHQPLQTHRSRRGADKKPPKWQQRIQSGTAQTTFVIGILLSFPGVSYLAALDRLGKLHSSTIVIVLVVIGFNLVQLVLLEIPIVAFEFAPHRTPAAIDDAKAWVGEHGRELAIGALAVIGGWLAIRGIANLH